MIAMSLLRLGEGDVAIVQRLNELLQLKLS
jgi:hypothetical protein